MTVCDACAPMGPPYCVNFGGKASYESSWERVAVMACSERCIWRLIEYELTAPASYLDDLTDRARADLIRRLDGLIAGKWYITPLSHDIVERLAHYHSLSLTDICGGFVVRNSENDFVMYYLRMEGARRIGISKWGWSLKEIHGPQDVGELTRGLLDSVGFFG